MTWDDKICRSFSPFRRLFHSRRLSALAASAIKKDLEGFRQVVLARRMAGGTWWDMVGHGGTGWDMVGRESSDKFDSLRARLVQKMIQDE